MAKQTSKSQLLSDIQAERKRLEKSLTALSKEDMLCQDVVGTWSIKDLLAHLAAWEQLFMEWYQAGLRDEHHIISPVGMSRKAMEDLNCQIYEKYKASSLEGVLKDFDASYQEILLTIQAIPEEEMFARGYFAWTGRFTLADYIAGNTCNHYAWARRQIRKWVDINNQKARSRNG
ncbi:MAG: DinB family protein [Omnitrophica WOR_2 bacterium]